jgi:kynurenine formamidase
MTKKIKKKAGAKRAPSDLDTHLRSLLASGRVRLVDLTQTLSPDFSPIVLPPEMGQCRPFRMEEISRYDERGPGWYWNNLKILQGSGSPLRVFAIVPARTGKR